LGKSVYNRHARFLELTDGGRLDLAVATSRGDKLGRATEGMPQPAEPESES
jgi:hypothetical protein